MKKLLNFLLNPFVLPILPTIILILFLPFNYDRYVLEVEHSKKLASNQFEWYDDLTLDGNSERIIMNDSGNYTWVAIYDNQGALYNQWNLSGNVDFMNRQVFSISGDYDDCGQKELFFFTIKRDSILMHSIGNLKDPFLVIQDRFITRIGPGKDKPDPRLIHAEMDDLDGDGKKELIFGLGSGFSLYPRSVFAYYIDKDSLVRSPESFYHIVRLYQGDINGDGKKEIIPMGMASSNVSPSQAKYHDYSNWIMVLDQNLEFLFEPIEIPGSSNGFYPLLIEQEGKNELKGLVSDRQNNQNAKIFSVSALGEVVEIRDVGMNISLAFVTYDRPGNSKILLSDPDTGSWIYDYPKNDLKHFSKAYMSMLLSSHYDFEDDGKKEAITISLVESKVFVFRQGMKQPAYSDIQWSTTNPQLISFKESTTAPAQICFQIGQDYYLLNYGANPAYYLNFLYFLLIYFGMLGFAVATRKAQQNQIQHRLDTEKKIAELQLSLVKNQLDPHFTMNAINAIIHSVTQNETEKANENLKRFSRLYRSLLLSAENPLRSLREELDFCHDYLELEKARFGDAFDFKIQVAEGVDPELQVPKMIIQTHAENAVKHGLSRKENDGLLKIDISPLPEGLEISITDNGIGRTAAAKNFGISTGKGLAIMKEFYNLYKKYYKKNISADIQDLFDEEGRPLGTRVIIRISRHEESI